MANSYRDTVQQLLDEAALRFQSKGTPYDVLYTEQETMDRSMATATYPGLGNVHVPSKCIPGERHPRCPYLILVDAYRTGGDDHHDNWTLMYRVDLQQLTADAGEDSFQFPDVLANDQAQVSFPYSDDSPDITWTFDVVQANNDPFGDPSGNPVVDPDDNPFAAPAFHYAKPTQGTPHPLNPGALFLSETWQRGGPVLTVTRHYKMLAPLSTQSKIGYKITCEYAGYYLVDWVYDTAKSDYNPPTPGSSCPVNEGGALDFSAYKVIEPPTAEATDTQNLRVTVTYGALPGPLVPMSGFSDGATSKGTEYTQRRAMSDVFSSAALKLDSVEVNGYSQTWKWHVPTAVTLSGEKYDPDTGLRDLFSQLLVNSGTAGQDLDDTGAFAAVTPLNEFYALKETTVLALFNQRPTFVDYELDPETRDLITVTRQIIVGHGAPSVSVGSEVTQKQLNTQFSLRTRRSLSSEPTAYDVPDHVDFTRPSLLTSLTGYSGDDGNTWIVNQTKTSRYRRQLQARLHVSFHSTPPANSTVWVINPTTFNYDGVHFRISLLDVLTDGYPSFGASGGDYVELVDIPASSPTLTEYEGAVGNEQLWSEQCSRWRYGYWKLEQLYIIPE